MAGEKMSLHDWLDDLCVRFIINLPREELESVERICFQVEEAQWFYEDFIRPLDPTLPSMNLKTFSLCIFQHCPLLSQFSLYHHSAAFAEFLAYKTRVPVRGAILLNDDMDQVVLVKGWKKGANWSFPRGKINKDEQDLDCAIREVYEETGFDVRKAGLVGEESGIKFIDVPIREQNLRLYVFRGVPLDTHFEPKTRKEISKISWYKLTDLPTYKRNKKNKESMQENTMPDNKFYMVAPFLGPLKKWINQQNRRDAERYAVKCSNDMSTNIMGHYDTDLELTNGEEEPGSDFLLDKDQINDRSLRLSASQPVEDNMTRLLTRLRSSADTFDISSGQTDNVNSEKSHGSAEELKRLLSVGQSTHRSDVYHDDKMSANSNLLLSMLGGQKNMATSLQATETRTLDIEIQQVPQVGPKSMITDDVNAIKKTEVRVVPGYNVNFSTFKQAEVELPNLNQQKEQGFCETANKIPNPPKNFSHYTFPSHRLTNHRIASQSLPFSTNEPHHAPPASDLPPPKLNNHTLNLLNTLRNTSASSQRREGNSGPAYEIGTPDTSTEPSQTHQLPNNGSYHRPQPTSSPIPTIHPQANITHHKNLATVNRPPNNISDSSAETLHRNKLIGLLRNPQQSSKSPSLSVVPDSNLGTDSIGKDYPQKGSLVGEITQPSRHQTVPKYTKSLQPTNNSLKSHGNQTTVQEHERCSDFEQSKYSGREILAPVNSQSGRSHHRALELPIQQSLTNRQSGSEQQKTSALLPVELSASHNELSRPSLKTFQSRPDNSRPASGQETKANSLPFLDRRDQVPAEHKNTLLSLFTKPPSMRGVSSPALSGTRLQRTGSTITNVSAALDDASSTKSATKAAASPVDRQLLLGYLEEVVKGRK